MIRLYVLYIQQHRRKRMTDYTLTDAHALAKKLVEVGKWRPVCTFFYKAYLREKATEPKALRKGYVEGMDIGGFTAWLFFEPESPARFCYLVNAYLEEK
jgi:hypothetical protein